MHEIVPMKQEPVSGYSKANLKAKFASNLDIDNGDLLGNPRRH